MHVSELKGRPKFESGQFLGYILWKQSDGFHLRWTTKKDKAYDFQGKISCQTKVKITRRVRIESEDKINETKNNIIEWNTTVHRQIDGMDFLTPGNFKLELRINKKKIKSKKIFLGPQMIQPKKNPFTIIQRITEKKLTIEKEAAKKEPQTIYKPEPEYELEPKIEVPIPDSVYDPGPQPMSEQEPRVEIPIPEPLDEPTSILESEPKPEPASHPESKYEPETESEYEPITDQESAYEYETEPSNESEPRRIYKMEPEPANEYERVSEPIYESITELEPEQEPIYKTSWEEAPEPKKVLEKEEKEDVIEEPSEYENEK